MTRQRLAIFAIFLGVLCSVGNAAEDWLMFPGGDGPGKGKHIALLAGDEEYRSEEAMPMLAKILSQHHGFDCSVHFSINEQGFVDPTKQNSITGSEQFEKADAFIMSLRFRNWPEEETARFIKAIRRGVPLIGLRTSTHAFRGGRLHSFGKDVLGENWVSHWGRHKKEATLGVVEPGVEEHEILRGVGQVFGDSDVYEAYPPEDATILLRGTVLKGMSPTDPPADYEKKRSRGDKGKQGVNDPAMPIAWTREHEFEFEKTSRVFCTTLGAATDLTAEGTRRLVVNSVFWGLKMDVPKATNVDFVDEFKPTEYGFDIYISDRKPADYELGAAPATAGK